LFSKNLDGIQTTSISGIGNETGRFYLGFQEDFESCDQNDLGLQESGQEAGAAGTDCRNLHFHGPCCSPFFWNPAPLMHNYMIKSVKMTKKSIFRDQFSWKVRNFAPAFRKGCRSFCCSFIVRTTTSKEERAILYLDGVCAQAQTSHRDIGLW